MRLFRERGKLKLQYAFVDMDMDKIIHELYDNDAIYSKLPNNAVVRCKECGTPLVTYYAEERLYLVRCNFCKTITMVKSSNPIIAATMVGEVDKCEND